MTEKLDTIVLVSKRTTKKEDAGSTYGARGKEDQLRGTEERSTEP